MKDTIFALSSGGLPSGVAVVRISGSQAIEIVRLLTGRMFEPRRLDYCVLKSVDGSEVLDRCLVVAFEASASFTGEDCVELHLHGGIAVVSRVMAELGSLENTRLAEAGEFSRRAFENEKLDLTEAEGLADLISAETEFQRRLAFQQASGGLREKLEKWRKKIIRSRALIEAEFDFSDEEDVPDSMLGEVKAVISALLDDIEDLLSTSKIGEIIRDGFRIALLGPPNAGKSSLLNALAKRDVAIVSNTPGTTRDVVEVRLDIDGVPVIISDTAGIRETSDDIEVQGIERARKVAREADLVIWLMPADEEFANGDLGNSQSLVVRTKSDLVDKVPGDGIYISTVAEGGLRELWTLLREKVSAFNNSDTEILLSRKRHKMELLECHECLGKFYAFCDNDLTIASEYLRRAGDCIGRLTGRIDVEDLLDVVFSEFCVGK